MADIQQEVLHKHANVTVDKDTLELIVKSFLPVVVVLMGYLARTAVQ